MLPKLQLGAYTNELFFPSDSLTGMEFTLYTKVSTVKTLVSDHGPKMSGPGGCLQEVVTYENLDHVGSEFCPMVTAETYM